MKMRCVWISMGFAAGLALGVALMAASGLRWKVWQTQAQAMTILVRMNRVTGYTETMMPLMGEWRPVERK